MTCLASLILVALLAFLGSVTALSHGGNIVRQKLIMKASSRTLSALGLAAALPLLPLSVLPARAVAATFMSPESEGGGGRFGSVVPSALPDRESATNMPSRGFQTKSGLKYFDIETGSGRSPRYGELVTFHYTMYYKPPLTETGEEAPLERLDDSRTHVPVGAKKGSQASRDGAPFLHKHGNGRVVRGVDEGLHSMAVGGRRRIVVPRSVGYTDLGLGPLPTDGTQRRRLGTLLDSLNRDPPEGELVFDLQLLAVAEDENDQGYYDDVPVSQDDVRRLAISSLESNRPEFLKKVQTSTPKELYKK